MCMRSHFYNLQKYSSAKNICSDSHDWSCISKYQICAFWKEIALTNNPTSLHPNLIDAQFSDRDQVYIFRTCWRDSSKILIVQHNFSPLHIKVEVKIYNSFHSIKQLTINCNFQGSGLKQNCSIHLSLRKNNLNAPFWSRTDLYTSFWDTTGAKIPNWVRLRFSESAKSTTSSNKNV